VAERLKLLAAAKNDGNELVRKRAASAVMRLGGPDAKATVYKRLGDKSESVRESALTFVDRLGKADALDVIGKAVKDESVRVRRAAMWKLTSLHAGLEALPIVEKAMWDSDPQVRTRVFAILQEVGASDGMASPKERAVVIAVLRKGMTNPDPKIRSGSAWVMGVVGGAEVVPYLERAIEDKDLNVRSSALSGLAQIGSKKAVELLRKALGDPEARKRKDTVYPVRMLGVPKALPLLRRALGDPDWNVRNVAAEQVGRLGQRPEVIKILKSALASGSVELRSGAARATGFVKGPDAWKLALDAVRDKAKEVRWEACESIGRINGPGAAGVLEEALKDREVRVRGEAARALSKIATEEALKALLALMTVEKEPFPKQCAIDGLADVPGENALRIVVKALNDETPAVRRRAVTLLKRRKQKGDPELTALLDRLKVETDQNICDILSYFVTTDKSFEDDPRTGPAVEAARQRLIELKEQGHPLER